MVNKHYSISLRPLEEKDTSLIVKWRNSEAVLPYFLDQRKITEESHLEYYKTHILTGKWKQWIILADEKPIGTCFLRDINYEKKKAEYGVFIGEADYQSKGIGPVVLEQVVNYAFHGMNLDILYARVQKKNERSWKSFLKDGFSMSSYTEEIMLYGKKETVVFLYRTKSPDIKITDEVFKG